MSEAIAAFQREMEEKGLGCSSPLIADGVIHRFDANGDKGNSKNGWYVGHDDEYPTIVFGSWKTNEQFTWSLKSPKGFSSEEQQHHNARMQEAKAASERLRVEKATQAATQAQASWDASKPAPPDHPYLQHKRAQPHGIRLLDQRLAIPLHDHMGGLVSIQYIDVDGTKRFLTGGSIQGNSFSIGEPTAKIFICEGFSTGATIHEATNSLTVVAFNCGNLKPVAESIRKQYPHAQIIIAADNDAKTEDNPGLTKGREAANAINGTVVYPTFEKSESGTDFNDLLHVKGLEEVQRQLRSQAAVSEAEAPIDDAPKWPELEPAALYGLPGEIVEAIVPFTEADQVTLLVHLISEFSCMIGRGPHILLDGDYSPLAFWPVVVGDTSKSRKGSGAKRIKRFYKDVNQLWTRGLHSGSLSSGEGLIYAVRDPEKKIDKDEQEITVDEGVKDKRLYLVQQEFGAMLRTMGREGNSLSGHVRESWDGETLKPMTKGHRIQATAPHISITGHITQNELLRNLNDVEMANGFGNRFVWFSVKRSKFLPFAENPPTDVMKILVKRMQEVLRPLARQDVNGEGPTAITASLEIGMTGDAKDAWTEVYKTLSTGTPGLAGSLLDRGEAQVRRLAALYCLLDSKATVEVEHLAAALALWKYAEESTKYIFGDQIGDPAADTILKALESGPKSDTDISELFGRHLSRQRLTQCKQSLVEQGKITSDSVATDGRSKIVWSLAKKAKKAN